MSPPAGAPHDRPQVLAWVSLGANQGDAGTTLAQALAVLGDQEGVRLIKASSHYRTAPFEAEGPDYVNAVALIATSLTAPALLDALQDIEAAFGRERPYPNAPRTLDLDLLLFGDATIRSPRLTVPHPRMWERAFVLVPLHEVEPALVPADRLSAVSGQAIERINRPQI